jgi:L-ascorbate metabolism protein UlaG (beta-lactamase superfamily)
MQLTKHAHACVVLDKGAGHLVVDPGAFNDNARDLIAGTEVVLITHEHFDHFDEEALAAALSDRPELKVYGPEAVVGRWEGRPDQITAVAEGDTISAAGFDITVHGDLHAEIHPDIPLVSNVGYLVDGAVYHPGDAYHVPPGRVRTLLLPTSGPWASTAQAVDYVRAVAPEQAVQIHELLLSDVGQQLTKQFVGAGGLTDVPLELVPVGDTVEV